MTKVLIAVLSFIGIGIMGYLTYIHYANAQSFCDLSETVSCDIVTTSIYSEILGIPISFAGLGYFVFVLALLSFNKSKKIYHYIFYITILMIIPSLYFSFLEVAVIKTVCILCESSKVLMFLILGLSFYNAKKVSPITLRMVAPLVITGLTLSVVIFFMQTGNTVKKDYTKLVSCLNEQGLIYYKSVKCNNCKRQEKLFGESIKKLNSIECHPEGKDPKPEFCLEKKISKTPTFILEKEGKEIKRAEGLQPISRLAEFAGCKLEDN